MAQSEDKLAAFFICVNYTKYFLIFIFLADYIQSKKHIRLIMYAFALGICAHFLLAFVELLTGGGISIQGTNNTTLGTRLVFENAGGVHAFRPSGLMGHPNALADFMVFILPTLLMLILLGKNLLGRFVWYVAGSLFLISVITLILTLSRAGWISFIKKVWF